MRGLCTVIFFRGEVAGFTIKVEVRLAGTLGGAGDVRKRQIAVSRGTTVASLLERISSELGRELLRPPLLVAVNGRSVPEGQRHDRLLQEGDTVSLVRAFGGG